MSSVLFMWSVFFFVMIRRPPRSTLDRSSAASDVYKRQREIVIDVVAHIAQLTIECGNLLGGQCDRLFRQDPVSYTHLRAHETVLDIVCRLLLEKKKKLTAYTYKHRHHENTRNSAHASRRVS